MSKSQKNLKRSVVSTADVAVEQAVNTIPEEGKLLVAFEYVP